jgi:hypothetical protein
MALRHRRLIGYPPKKIRSRVACRFAQLKGVTISGDEIADIQLTNNRATHGLRRLLSNGLGNLRRPGTPLSLLFPFDR